MNRRAIRILLVAMGLGIGAIAVFFVLKTTDRPQTRATGLAAQFMECLPHDLSEAQRLEIEGLLIRFQTRAREGFVKPEDERELIQIFRQYIDKGAIDRSELNVVMAKVGYYSVRGSSIDSTGMHPLLDPIER